MHRIFLPIDTKSLYLNIFNDNEKGHTCTVATPIVQGNSHNANLEMVYKIPNQIDFQGFPNLITRLSCNSKSIIKINNVFVFDKIKVNGNNVLCDSSYCIFTKEEVDPSRTQFGRIKLHYPISLKFEELNIDNRKVLQSISEALNEYAFIVNGFEYDFDDNSLNFIATIVGYNGIPYSRVFINTKGMGSKFTKIASENEDSYDLEIVRLRQLYGDEASIETFSSDMEKARMRGIERVTDFLKKNGAADIKIISNVYSYSVFDIQYFLNGVIYYCLVKTTYTNYDYLDLTSEQYRFVNLFSTASIALVKNIFQTETIIFYNSNDLDKFRTNIRAIRLLKGGE